MSPGKDKTRVCGYIYIYIYIYIPKRTRKNLSMEAYSRYIKQDCKRNNLLNIAE